MFWVAHQLKNLYYKPCQAVPIAIVMSKQIILLNRLRHPSTGSGWQRLASIF